MKNLMLKLLKIQIQSNCFDKKLTNSTKD